MTRTRLAALSLVASCAAAVAGCSSSQWAWRATELWSGTGKIQAVAVGDADPQRAGSEVIGVDQAGRVVRVANLAGPVEASIVHDHGAKLTGLLIADLDPAVPGAEVYAGGHLRGEEGGAVIQLVLRGDDIAVRRVWEGEGFVHALAPLPGAGDGPGTLVVTTYAGEVALATAAAGDGLWPARTLHREPDTGDPELRKIKDCLTGAVGGGPRAICIGVKSGRVVRLDPAGIADAELLHTEPGGVARMALAADGSIWFGANSGRVVRLHRDGGDWAAAPAFRDSDKIRGIATGRFPTPAGPAAVAIFGYARACRLLTAGAGGAAEAVTLFEDTDRGHWLAAGNCVAGNRADELVCGSYSGRIVLLQWAPHPFTPTPGGTP